MRDGRLMVLTRDEKQAATAINIEGFYDLCNIEIKYFDTMNRRCRRAQKKNSANEGVEIERFERFTNGVKSGLNRGFYRNRISAYDFR
jgi:hypothetical protein